MPDDPHRNAYSFAVSSFKLNWYNSDGAVIRSDDLTDTVASNWAAEYDPEYATYYFQSEASSTMAEGAATIRGVLTLRDTTTGKTYTAQPEHMDLY